jgi:tetratricopeptide (TPR) repeat protein
MLISAGAQPLRVDRNAESGGRDTNGLTVLKAERALKRKLAAHQAHSFSIELTLGQYMRFVVHPQGVGIQVTLFDPQGNQLSTVTSPSGRKEPKPVSIIAESSGNYRLDVRSMEKSEGAGRYELKIEELRTATSQDKSQVATDQVFMQAELLRANETAQSLKAAIAKYEEALVLSRTAEDRSGQARALNHIGELYDSLGEKQKALGYFAEVLLLRRRLSERHGEARAAVRISELYKDLGEIQKAVEYLEIALKLNRAVRDPGGEAAVLTAIGSQYISLGDSRKALDVYSRALALWRAVGDRSGEAKALGGLAKACIFRYQPLRALRYHTQALTIHRMLGDRRSEAHTLHNISWTYYTLGKKMEALDFNSQALPLMQAVGDRWGEAAIYTNLGWTSELSGDRQKALNYYNQALPLMQATGDWDGEANTLYRLANVERDLDDLPKARAYIERALSITESLRSTVANRKLRTSYAAFIQQYHEFYIDLLLRLHQQSRSQGYDAAALEASERARARGLLELLAEANVDIRQGVDVALLEQERNLQRLITAKTDRQIRVLNSKHTEQQASEAKKELAELVSAYHEVEAKIRIASPHYAALVQAQTLTLPQIQQLLDADTVLLEYALGDSGSYLWAITSNSIEGFVLEKRSVIEDAARRLYKLLNARTRQIPQEGGRSKEARIAKADVDYYWAASELSRLLLAPAASHLDKRRLLIVSDWALQYLPFGALPEPDSWQGLEVKNNVRPTADNYRPLILEHEIVNMPSASTLALLRRYVEGRNPPSKTVAVFADPVFEGSDNRVRQIKAASKRKSKPSTTAQLENIRRRRDDNDELRVIRDYLRRTGLIDGEQPLPRLSYSRKEALAIASLVSEAERNIVLDFDVNYGTMTDPQLGEYRFLHFATHAWLDTRDPELSGILLSLVDKEGRPQESGILRLGDVYNLNLPVELVTLSACETALGPSVKGEGMIGLTRGFMYAGAPRVLASLWKVDDVATADLMKLFYEGMLGPQRLRPAAALREAQKQMYLKNKQGSPFYWAGFVLQGEWR